MKLHKATFDCGAQGWWDYCKQLDPTVLQPVQEFLYYNESWFSRGFPKPQSMTTKTFCTHSLGMCDVVTKGEMGGTTKRKRYPKLPNWDDRSLIDNLVSVKETHASVTEVGHFSVMELKAQGQKFKMANAIQKI